MRAWYGRDHRQRDFVYVEGILFGLEGDEEFNWDYDPDTLQGLALLIQKGAITKEDLEKKDWVIEEVNIPDEIGKRFIDFCSRKKTKHLDRVIEKKCYKLLHYVKGLKYQSNLYDKGYYEGDSWEGIEEPF